MDAVRGDRLAARGDRLAVEVARPFGDALVAPTIRVGCSEHHMAFGGTLSLRPSTLAAVCCGHADIAESSEMMVLRPDLVRTGRAEAGYVGEADDALFERIFRDGFRSVTPNGVLGDARGLGREIGDRRLARSVEALAAALEKDFADAG